MIIRCLKCHCELEFPEESVGANVRCAECNEKFSSIQAVYEIGVEHERMGENLLKEGKSEESKAAWSRALDCYLLTAKAGHALSNFLVGRIYRDGWCGIKDPETAVLWFRAGVKMGDVKSLIALSRSYMEGLGVEKDEREAVHLMCQAAQKGDDESCYALSAWYEKGLGVTKDEVMSAAWKRTKTDDLFEAFAHLFGHKTKVNAVRIGREQFEKGISDFLGDQRFAQLAEEVPESTRRVLALLFWYKMHSVILRDWEKRAYVSYRDGLENGLDDAAVDYLVTAYGDMEDFEGVARLKTMLARRTESACHSSANTDLATSLASSGDGRTSKEDPLAGYVLPNGALQDREHANYYVEPDVPFTTSEGFVSNEIKCSACGHQYKIAYRKSLNVSENETLRTAVSKGTYFQFTCPKCGHVDYFIFRIWVYSVMKRYFIRMFEDLESTLSLHRRKSTLEGADWGFPNEFLPLVRHRLVLGIHGLMDKVRIFEAGLSDYAIEALKNYFTMYYNGATDVTAVYFDHLDEHGNPFFVLMDRSGTATIAGLKREMYDQATATYAKMGTFSEGVFRWVDRQTMMGDYCDMQEWWVHREDSQPATESCATELLSQARQEATGDGGKERDYVAVDLSAGPDAASYPVRRIGKRPEGGWPEGCKTTRLILARIPHGVFKMRGTEIWIKKDFYMGVFPVTQRQYELVCGMNPSHSKCANHPVESVGTKQIVGDMEPDEWLAGAPMDENSFLGRLRKRTGLKGVDIPTQSEWEYACRTLYSTPYCNFGTTAEDLKQVGVFRSKAKGWREVSHAPVGSLEPNRWGLYDMHGNVRELCVKRFNAKSMWVYAGGGWIDTAKDCKANSWLPMSTMGWCEGFRIIIR